MAIKVETTPSPTVEQLRADYLSDEDLAALHDVTVETIRRWRRCGMTAPSRKFGRRRWTHKADWQALFREQAA